MFLRRGFHGASLDEIADEAGYTTGAVYSNFKGKDDLFLAVLDAEAQRQLPHHVELLGEARSLEDGLRASARELASYPIDHPGWTGIYVEFWTHASRRPELRRKVAEQYERLLDTVGALVEEWARRWDVERGRRRRRRRPGTGRHGHPRGPGRGRGRRRARPAGAAGRPRPQGAADRHPGPAIGRDPGHGAKLKLVRSVPVPSS